MDKFKQIYEEFRKGYHTLKWKKNNQFDYIHTFDAFCNNEVIEYMAITHWIAYNPEIKNEAIYNTFHKVEIPILLLQNNDPFHIYSYAYNLKKIAQIFYLYYLSGINLNTEDLLNITKQFYNLSEVIITPE